MVRIFGTPYGLSSILAGILVPFYISGSPCFSGKAASVKIFVGSNDGTLCDSPLTSNETEDSRQFLRWESNGLLPLVRRNSVAFYVNMQNLFSHTM